MKIVIDARFWGTHHTGLGRYTKNIIPAIIENGGGNTYQILLNTKIASHLKFPDNVKIIPCDIPHYSLLEQIELPHLIDSLGADLLYFPHLNVPILLQTPYVLTIHDLIKSHFTGRDTTTRSPGIYVIKRMAYNIVLKFALKRAKGIVVPSQFVKNDLLKHTNKDSKMIHVIYEAPDQIFVKGLNAKTYKRVSKSLLVNHSVSTPYLLYVGNAYPHKNLTNLIGSLKKLDKKYRKLVVVSKNNIFIKRIFSALTEKDKNSITLLEEVTDEELLVLYKNATATVIPSLMEGFGLVGLESLAVGTPIVVSDIPVFREVYKDHATYFDPLDQQNIASSISSTLKQPKLKWNYKRTWDHAGKELYDILEQVSAHL